MEIKNQTHEYHLTVLQYQQGFYTDITVKEVNNGNTIDKKALDHYESWGSSLNNNN